MDGFAQNLARGRLPDVINCAQFSGNRFRDLHSVGGQILPFSIDLGCRRSYSAVPLMWQKVKGKMKPEITGYSALPSPSRLWRDTDTYAHIQRDRQMPSDTIPSPLAKQWRT